MDKKILSELAKRKPHLSIQFGEFYSLQLARFVKRLPQEAATLKKVMRWSYDFLETFLLARYYRANDVISSQISQARGLEQDFFGKNKHHFMVLCMDGRNLPAIMLSHVPHVGGVMRTQAGELFGFIEGSTPHSVLIDRNSFEAKQIVKLLLNKKGEDVYYSLDSHFGCAARGEIHNATGDMNKDNGLLDDVSRKLLIAQGICELKTLLQKEGHVTANIYPQLFSYEPHDGTLTMGLELHINTVGSQGFTPETIDNLSQKNQIVKTWDFLRDPQIVLLLEQEVRPADFRKHFPTSLFNNWQSITKLYEEGKGKLFVTILDRLTSIYRNKKNNKSQIPDPKSIASHELEHKAKVMLKNLVTRFSIAKTGHHWPFDTHIEQGIVITEGGYAPFPKLDVFSIFAKEDIHLLLDHTFLALQLVRTFRKKSSITDPLKQLTGDEFVRAPIMIINKAILRGISENSWQKLQKVDLTQSLKQINWDDPKINNWTARDIESLLHLDQVREPILPADTIMFVEGVFEVFSRMRAMMNDYRFRPMLLHGQAMVINILNDRNRRTRVFVPIVV